MICCLITVLQREKDYFKICVAPDHLNIIQYKVDPCLYIFQLNLSVNSYQKYILAG